MDGFNSLIADKNALTLLFEDKLYLLKEDKKAVERGVDAASVPASALVKGANHQGVVFLYRSDEELAQAEQQLFEDIVTKGLKLKLDDVALIRLALQEQITISQLQEKTTVNKLVLWGLSAADIGLTNLVPKYRVTQNDSYILLTTDPLEKISRDVTIKKQLWSSLQQMFV